MTINSAFDFKYTNLNTLFSLKDKIAIITGGAGLLGMKHAETIIEMGGTPILLDIDKDRVINASEKLSNTYSLNLIGIPCDITSEKDLLKTKDIIIKKYNRVDILINNAANNPKVENNKSTNFSRLENFPIEMWDKDIEVGLKGSFLASKVFGSVMSKSKKGVILNIASDLAIIAPDQRLYMKEGLDKDKQPVKPITYSVIKAGLLGLTKYLATYWLDSGIRCNALLPGGVKTNQDEDFLTKLNNLIPMNRMADPREYKGAVAFLCSDASSYMTGATITIDGGRTCW